VGQDREGQLRQLVEGHRAAFEGLLTATVGLDADGWATPTGCPGWDVHDQLAHCVGLERRFLGDPEPHVEVPDLPHLTDERGRRLERDVEVRRGVPGADLHAEATATFDRRLAELDGFTPDDLDVEVDGPFGRQKRSAFLRVRLFDLASHERDVRAALGVPEATGPYLPVVVEQVVRGWARTLPARVEGGGTLRLVVAGGPPVGLDLGAGTVTRGADVPPGCDATLEVSIGQLLALAGGRDDAPSLDETVAWSGDEHLLRRVLAVCAITP
jgi:uncharacterized protein (TIGR03083 family)